MNKILTIAGSDSGGGAGIQADLKTITVLGAYGSSVITALTAQNTKGVQGIHPVPAAFVRDQIRSVLSDIGADAVKTGMLANAEIISAVAAEIKSYRVEKLVVDPVLFAKGGAALTEPAALPALTKDLLPLAHIVTPNMAEASAMAGIKLKSVDDMEKAARKIHDLGAANVLVKGGHLTGEPVDVLFDGEDFHHFRAERVETVHTHGTGCTFAAALAAFLAQDIELVDAVAKAKSFVTLAIKSAFPVGKGIGPTNPYAYAEREILRYQVIKSLEDALDVLKCKPVGQLIPEVQSNLAYSLPFPLDENDVAAFPGRIIGIRNSIATVSGPAFGASHHIARLVMAVMAHDPTRRAAMNVRFNETTLRKCRELKWRVSSFDRREEPPHVKQTEGASLRWGVGTALKKSKRIPDIIYDCGDVGKEPMIRVLGRDPLEVVNKVLALA
ncbi:MAG: bifunctional hydroxymethylpyrimidine kinase/phosphomethylpyrimidine kinase [Pseudomonadota bacterium]